jgi:hypothetical protein
VTEACGISQEQPRWHKSTYQSNHAGHHGFRDGTDKPPETGCYRIMRHLSTASARPTGGFASHSSGTDPGIPARGEVLFAGRFFGADVYFEPGGGAGNLRSAGRSDAFVAKHGPDGALQLR